MTTEFPSLQTSTGHALVLRSMQAQGRLQGLLLEMTLTQVFRNDTRKNLEVVYTFPLAWGAVLLGMDARLGGRRMNAQVLAKQEAREQYEEALQRGDAPIMVEQVREGLFSATLGSLKPGEEAVIELRYAQLLAFEQGRLRVVVPTTIAPRHGDAVAQGGLSPDQVPAPDLLAEHGFGLTLTIAGPLARARISSPSHAVAQQRVDAGLSISLARGAWLDRDFVLLLEGLEGRSLALAGPDERSGPGHAALIASCCPALPAAQPAPLRLKLLVDCSGSMNGDSMVQAKAALAVLAQGLTAGDWVSYSRFGSAPRRVLQAAPCGWWHIRALRQAIAKTEADLGGTEMAAALQDTVALPMGEEPAGHECDVLLITDGEVWGAQDLVDLARRSGHRIYALGVGSAPAESLLRELAEATGGACEFASPNEDMGGAIARLLARIQQAQAVRASFDLQPAPLWMSPLPLRLVPGETVHVHARLAARPAVVPGLSIGRGTLDAPLLTWVDGDLVARLVAARQVGACAQASQAKPLAERYALVTSHTNLLLVFERAEHDKTDGMPDLHSVQPMLAAGWGGTGSTRPASLSQRVLSAKQPDPGSMSVQSVWRNNRTQAASKVDALVSGGLENFEVPAFLRKQADLWDAVESQPKAAKVRSLKRPAQPAEATLESFVEAFNLAARQGQPFRQTLRAAMSPPLDPSVLALVLKAANLVRGPVNAWACLLFWLHRQMPAGQGLSDEALALVLSHEQPIAVADKKPLNELFAPLYGRLVAHAVAAVP